MPYPKPFEYYAPATMEDALHLIAENQDRAKVIAGGQSLLPLMRFRLLNPAVLVDISKHLRGELSYVSEGQDGISIGALTTHYEISTSKVIRARCPMLAKAAEDIGDFQVRNRGTIGGSLCHADPAAHYLPAAMALNAELIATGEKGSRVVKAADFFKDMFTIDLHPDEILTEIRIPKPFGIPWGYEAIHGQGGSYATAIAAVLLNVNASVCESASIVIGGATAIPVRLTAAEDILIGKTLTEEILLEAAKSVLSGLREPLVDPRVRAPYRREMASLAAKRALLSAFGGV
jgi:carbon-monoxide dehydrogenase medium subunit